MRNTLLASAALLGLAVAVPAFAQTSENTPAPAATTRQAMPMKQHPMKMGASNIDPADTHSTIAPALPVPPLGPDATPQQFLQQAQIALQHHRSGAAQEALERAETRLLDRSTASSAASQPDMSPMVRQLGQARDALGRHDWPQADQLISEMLKNPAMAAATGSGMAGPAMNGMSGGLGAADSPASTDSMGMPAAHSGDAGMMPPAAPGTPGTLPQGAGAPQP